MPENIDLIVLAGFLSILSKDFCQKYKGKIINIHPALLPKFGGKGMWGHHVHEAVIEAKEKESGATVHFVTSGIDEGEIILQGKFEISEDETPETLAEKVHEIEYDIFPKAINHILNGYNLNYLFYKVFNEFYWENYFNKNDSVYCSIHQHFKIGHNCVGCNLERQNELLFDFLKSYESFESSKLTFNIFIWLLYLQVESIYTYFEILQIDGKFKGDNFKTFSLIKKWTNFLKHPKSFMAVHHPIFGFYQIDNKVESILCFEEEITIDTQEYIFINSEFIKKYYEDKRNNNILKEKITNKSKVIVVFPNPLKLMLDFINEQKKFISLIAENENYIEKLNIEMTLEDYFDEE